MKKIILTILSIVLITGCSSNKQNEINGFKKAVKKSDAYTLKGTMELKSDEETFDYNIKVSYKKEDKYLVEMTNLANNNKQIILKNEDGLYVITPSLNKSFKFDSNWPKNSSVSYILSSIVNDIENDEKVSYNAKEGYIKTKVDYPNNSDLEYQKIYIKKSKITKVEVFSENDLSKIEVNFSKVNMNANINDDIFKIDNYIEPECKEDCDSKKTMGSIQSAIYPLYMPANTYLSSSEMVNSEENSRVILTFAGDKNFVIVEEAAIKNEEHELVPVYGEPFIINDTIAALSNNSVYWTSGDISYYLVSDDLSKTELATIASSLGNSVSTASTK